MKKILVLGMVLTVLLVTSGCQQKSAERKQCEALVKSLGGSAADAAEECSDY